MVRGALLNAAKVTCLHENQVIMKCATFAGQECQGAIQNSRDVLAIYSTAAQAPQLAAGHACFSSS